MTHEEEGGEEGDKETDTCGEIEEEEISRQRDGVREMRLLQYYEKSCWRRALLDRVEPRST